MQSAVDVKVSCRPIKSYSGTRGALTWPCQGCHSLIATETSWHFSFRCRTGDCQTYSKNIVGAMAVPPRKHYPSRWA